MKFQCQIPVVHKAGSVELHVGRVAWSNDAAGSDAWHRLARSLEDRGIDPDTVRVVQFAELERDQLLLIKRFIGMEGTWP